MLFACVLSPYKRGLERTYTSHDHTFMPSMDVVMESAKLSWGEAVQLTQHKMHTWMIVLDGEVKATVFDFSPHYTVQPEIL